MLKKIFAGIAVFLLVMAVYFQMGGTRANEAVASTENKRMEDKTYIPFLTGASCHIAGQTYDTLSTVSVPSDIPADEHPDLNLAIRGYELYPPALLELVDYAGGRDTKAPQLDTLFADERVPNFQAGYQVHGWDWDCNCPTDVYTNWDVTHLGMGVAPHEVIHTPDSGYDIGGGHDALVIYASPTQITLKYTRDDNVVSGYTIHLENVCVDTDLLSLYEARNAAGRGSLPALTGGQPLGLAIGTEIGVSIRDSGSFLDPRSRKDWWQNH